jgi:hypothetical protein
MKMNSKALLVLCALGLATFGCKKSATVEGEGAQRLTLKQPSAVTLHRGGTATTDVEITRHGITGEVTVKFDNLPKGVDVVDASNRIIGDRATYTLRASDTADLVEKSVAQVTASTSAGPSVSQNLDVTVKEKK